MSMQDQNLVDWNSFAQTRSELGAAFLRILGYFQEDGMKSVAAIEQAMRAGSAAGLVLPAHTLKGEARQFGAEPLALVAEEIENIARMCVETRDTPEAAMRHVVGLRAMFEATLALLLEKSSPLVERRPGGFGRRALGG